jgi:hypothetical protein
MTGPGHEYTGLTSGLKPCPGCQTGYHDYSVFIDARNPSDEHVGRHDERPVARCL